MPGALLPALVAAVGVARLLGGHVLQAPTPSPWKTACERLARWRRLTGTTGPSATGVAGAGKRRRGSPCTGFPPSSSSTSSAFSLTPRAGQSCPRPLIFRLGPGLTLRRTQRPRRGHLPPEPPAASAAVVGKNIRVTVIIVVDGIEAAATTTPAGITVGVTPRLRCATSCTRCVTTWGGCRGGTTRRTAGVGQALVVVVVVECRRGSGTRLTTLELVQ